MRSCESYLDVLSEDALSSGIVEHSESVLQLSELILMQKQGAFHFLIQEQLFLNGWEVVEKDAAGADDRRDLPGHAAVCLENIELPLAATEIVDFCIGPSDHYLLVGDIVFYPLMLLFERGRLLFQMLQPRLQNPVNS